MKTLLSLLLIVVLSCVKAWSAPAFPGAEGFGAQAVGGRGGRVLEVTTLADSGPGSLRAAVEAKGSRMVVFRVAGTIALTSDLKIVEPYITIAGQSAPGDGITLRDHALVVSASEVVVRYLRVRLGDTSRVESDAVTLSSGRNIILDHVSASWSVDETLSVSQRLSPGVAKLDRVTVQWSVIAESLNHSQHSKGEHGYGSLVRGAEGASYSFHHNLWAHHRSRMPRPGNYAAPAEDPLGPLMDFRNNVFYNWGGSYAGYNADTDAVARYNFVGNYYQRGPDSGKQSVVFQESSAGARAYFADNWLDGVVPDDPWSLVNIKVNAQTYRAVTAFPVAEVVTERADQAYERVLRNSGSRCLRDSVDTRVINSVRQGSGRLIDSQEQVGGWPALQQGVAYTDTDHDGMSDEWERLRQLNPAQASDGARLTPDGYTWLEQFLNERAAACEST